METTKKIDFSDLETKKAFNDVVYGAAYSRLQALIEQGKTCILDCSSRTREFRMKFFNFCESQGLSAVLIRCCCSYRVSKYRIATPRPDQVSSDERHLLYGLLEYEPPLLSEPCSIVEFDSEAFRYSLVKVRKQDEQFIGRIVSVETTELESSRPSAETGEQLVLVRRPLGAEARRGDTQMLVELTRQLRMLILMQAEPEAVIERIEDLECNSRPLIEGNMERLELALERLLRGSTLGHRLPRLLIELSARATGTLVGSLLLQVAMRLPKYRQSIYGRVGVASPPHHVGHEQS